MELKSMGTTSDWHGAFDKARELLVADQLTAIAVVSGKEYASGRYVASQLKEFEQVMGCIDAVVDNLERMSPMLYGEKHSFRLAHGTFTSNHPLSTGEDWLLLIVYDN